MKEEGTWVELHAEVDKRADAAGKIDWVVWIDSTIARVHQHGATLKRGHRGLYRITRILALSRLTTRSDAPGAA